MWLQDLFKKNQKESSFSENAKALGGVHQIIDILWGEDGVKQVVSECKEIINSLIAGEGIKRKTDILSFGLDWSLELLSRTSKNPKTTLGGNCITAFIYYRYYFECVLAIDTDIMDISHLYAVFQVTKHIPAEAHLYIQTMIKIYDLLDRGIVYLYENIDNVEKDYFTIVASKIQKMLDAYEDDNTDWNKI